MQYQSNTSLPSRTIAIDVTPILPGGENGGAKIFVLELIRGLAQVAPQSKFILLTQTATHNELAVLDCKNVRRVMVIESPDTVGGHARGRGYYSKLKGRLPSYIRRRLAQGAYTINGLLKRSDGKRVLRQFRADLLFCPFTAPTFFDSRVPIVSTVYDLQFATYPQFFEPEDAASRKSLFMDACRKANMLVAISDYSRKSAMRYGNLASNQIKTISLRMAQRISLSEDASSDILDRLQLSPKRYLLYPANFWKHKNHEMLITAFGMACAQGLPQDLKFVCSGTADARKNYIQNAAENFSLDHRMVFPGYLNNDEFAILLYNAGGLVFPSLYEGFGLPVIEAMAAGVPVACSNITSLPEVTGSAAILFDPRKPTDIVKSMIDLVNDKALRHQLVEKGYRQADLFSDTDQMIFEYWNTFQTILCKR